jgi:hypothetical protein
MDGLVTMEGAEGITGVGRSWNRNAIYTALRNSVWLHSMRNSPVLTLANNPVLTDASALAHAKNPYATFSISDVNDMKDLYASFKIRNNTNLERVPCSWPAEDMYGRTFPHGPAPESDECCTAATAGLKASTVSQTNPWDTRSTMGIKRSSFYYVSTNEQLLGLSKCTSIDYLLILGCADCTQVAWSQLQLQTITGEDPEWGFSLALEATSRITDMGGVKNVKGVLLGWLVVANMFNIVSMDGTEGIVSIGLRDELFWGTVTGSSGSSRVATNTSKENGGIMLVNNPVLVSATALTNVDFHIYFGWDWVEFAYFLVDGNPKLESVPCAWPANDDDGTTIPHGNCPTTSVANAALPAEGVNVLLFVVVGVFVCAAAILVGVVSKRRRHLTSTASITTGSQSGSAEPVSRDMQSDIFGAEENGANETGAADTANAADTAGGAAVGVLQPVSTGACVV